MGRLFCVVCLLAVMHMPAKAAPNAIRPVLFSMLFPQLTPQWAVGESLLLQEATAGEAVTL